VHTDARGSTTGGGSVVYAGNEQAANQHAPTESETANLDLMKLAKLPKD